MDGSGRYPLTLVALIVLFGAGLARAGSQDYGLVISSRSAPEHRGGEDARHGSPQATLRTFLLAMNQAPEQPRRIDDALACMDLSGLPPEQRRQAGVLAYGLERVLRSLGVNTYLVPRHIQGSTYVFIDEPERHVALARRPNGSWVFDALTTQMLPRMMYGLRRAEMERQRDDDAGDVPAAYRSPRATVQTFMQAIRDRDLDAAAACLDLSMIPGPARSALGPALAIKLKEVLVRHSLLLPQDISDLVDGDPAILLAHEAGRVALMREAAGERRGQWLFGRFTVESLQDLYDAYEDRPIVPELAHEPNRLTPALAPGLWLRSHLPEWARAPIPVDPDWAFSLYQVIGLALLGTLGLLARRLAVRAAAALVAALFHRCGVPIEPAAARAHLRPIGWLVPTQLLAWGVTLLDLRLNLAILALSILDPLEWILLIVSAYSLVELMIVFAYTHGLTDHGRSALTEMVMPVLSLVIKIAVVVAGLVLLLKRFDVDVTTLLAGLGIGGVAVALAAQDTLKNFFGSLTLIADRTFRVGDLIKIGECEGNVEAVGLRSTRVRCLDDALLNVPNAQLTTMPITNFGARRFRRFRTQIDVPYDTPPALLTAFRDGIIEAIRRAPLARQEGYEVHVHALGPSAISILLIVCFNVRDHHGELLARDALLLEIVRLADRLGVEFAFPTQTIHLAGAAEPPAARRPRTWIPHAAESPVPSPHAGNGAARASAGFARGPK